MQLEQPHCSAEGEGVPTLSGLASITYNFTDLPSENVHLERLREKVHSRFELSFSDDGVLRVSCNEEDF